MSTLSRREVFKVAGAAGVAAAIPDRAEAQQSAPAPAPTLTPPTSTPSPVADAVHLFLNDYEVAFLRAAVDHLIPPDGNWPGAADAGVVEYLDGQLASAHGSGDRLFLQGPWKQGTPQQGYQLPFTPAQLYRNAMTALRQHLESRYGGRPFEQLDRKQQEALLRDMETGKLDLGDVPSAVFFETLLANTIEGFFADPAYGGNKEMAGWRMIGFPGAYASYADLVGRHGMKFERPPIGMTQTAHAGHGLPR